MDLSNINNIGDLIVLALAQGQGDIVERVSDLHYGFLKMFASLLGISIMLYGVIIMFRNMHMIGDIAKTFALAMIAVSFVNTGFFEDFYALLMETRVRLSIYLMPGKGNSIFTAIQDSFESFYALGSAIFDSGSVMNDPMPLVIGIVVMAVCAIYYISVVANLLLCEFFLVILYLLGSFVIMLSCFKSARPLFKSWVVSVAKYSLVFIVSGLIISIIDNGMKPMLYEVAMISNEPDGEGSDKYSLLLGGILVMACFGSYLMSRAMELSAELTGAVMSDGNAGVQSLKNGFASTANTLRARY